MKKNRRLQSSDLIQSTKFLQNPDPIQSTPVHGWIQSMSNSGTGHHGHDLHCKTNTGEVSRTAPGLVVLIDLTKAFDSVDRAELWQILLKIGCPQKFVNIIRSFHEGMMGQVTDDGEISTAFSITNGTKQGCVLAPLLFCIFFAMMLLIAFKDCELMGVPVRFRTDGNVFNLRGLQARTKTFAAVIRDLLHADDCAFFLAHSEADAQHLFDRFCMVASRFGLTVSLKKTEVLLQPHSRSSYISPSITAGDIELPVVDKLCYLGSFLTSDGKAEEDINSRIAKASTALGRLRHRLWDDHGIRLDTKISVYVAVILTILLCGCETWTLYRHNIRKLDQFHMRCLCRIVHIQRKDKVPNTEVLQICNLTGIEAMLMTAQYRWVGHVARMEDTRLPKIIFIPSSNTVPAPMAVS